MTDDPGRGILEVQSGAKGGKQDPSQPTPGPGALPRSRTMTARTAERKVRSAAKHVAHDKAAVAAIEAANPVATAKKPQGVAKVAKVKVERPICTAAKKDGTACTAKCIEDGKGGFKETCVDHQPAWDRLTHEEHVAFGGWLRKAKAADIVDVIGWYRAKQIAADVAGEVAEMPGPGPKAGADRVAA